MFSKYTTKIILKLAHVFEQWAESMFENFDNKKQRDVIRPSESVFNVENNPDWQVQKSVGMDKNGQVLQNNINVNKQLRNDHNSTDSKNQSLASAATDEHEWSLQNNKHHEQVVPESVIPSYPEQNSRIESGKQIEPHTSVSFNRETVNSELNKKNELEHTETKYSASCSEHAALNNTGATTKLQKQTKEKTENKNITNVIASSKKRSQVVFDMKNELKDSLTDVSNHVSSTTEPRGSKSSTSLSAGNNEFPDGSYEAANKLVKKESVTPSPMIKNSPPVAKARITSGQHGENSTGSSVNRLQTSIRITADSQSSHHATQPFVNTDLHWPSLPGQTKQKNESQTGITSHRWPELPVETTATESSLLSNETIQASITLVREMDRIRYLENEQKGMLWNA